MQHLQKEIEAQNESAMLSHPIRQSEDVIRWYETNSVTWWSLDYNSISSAGLFLNCNLPACTPDQMKSTSQQLSIIL